MLRAKLAFVSDVNRWNGELGLADGQLMTGSRFLIPDP